MDAFEIIEAIRSAKKKTPVKAYIRSGRPLQFENCHVFTGADTIVMGDLSDIAPVLEQNRDAIEDLVIENDRRNSALPLLDLTHVNARIEPGAIIRDRVEIGDGAVIADADEAFFAPPLKIEVRSTVGAGDAMVAALTCGFAAGKGLEEAFRMGVASASAMCMTEGSEPPARADFAALLQTVQMERI